MKNRRLKGPQKPANPARVIPLGKVEKSLWGPHAPPKESPKDELFNFLHHDVEKEFQKGLELEADMGDPTEIQFHNFHPTKIERQKIYQTAQRISEMSPSASRLELSISRESQGMHMAQLHLWSFAEELHLQRSAFTVESLMEQLRRDSEAKIQRWKKRRFLGKGENEYPKETA